VSLSPPQLSATEPRHDVPLIEGDSDISDLWLTGARLLDLDLDRPECLDVRLDDCDVSGAAARDFVVRRMELRRTRLRGVTWTGGQCDDVLVEGCATSELSLRFSRLRRVVFRDCELAGIDLYAVNFEQVRFERCDLSRATLHEATVKSLRITDCDLTGLIGATRLRGAEIDLSDLASLAPSLALEAGIRLIDD
jgi:uncharacterized protein YjbI with pentapeptide repeats